MDVESFMAMAEYSYVNNKIMEIAHVKEEAEKAKEILQDNPRVVHALYDILAAKQKQIQKALDRSKINEQDHSKLLERLNAVKDLLKHPNGSATR
jgi:DNA repair ATPase RecN